MKQCNYISTQSP